MLARLFTEMRKQASHKNGASRYSFFSLSCDDHPDGSGIPDVFPNQSRIRVTYLLKFLCMQERDFLPNEVCAEDPDRKNVIPSSGITLL